MFDPLHRPFPLRRNGRGRGGFHMRREAPRAFVRIATCRSQVVMRHLKTWSAGEISSLHVWWHIDGSVHDTNATGGIVLPAVKRIHQCYTSLNDYHGHSRLQSLLLDSGFSRAYYGAGCQFKCVWYTIQYWTQYILQAHPQV